MNPQGLKPKTGDHWLFAGVFTGSLFSGETNMKMINSMQKNGEALKYKGLHHHCGDVSIMLLVPFQKWMTS